MGLTEKLGNGNSYYHGTSLENAEKILREGYILSQWFLDLRDMFRERKVSEDKISLFLSDLDDILPGVVPKAIQDDKLWERVKNYIFKESGMPISPDELPGDYGIYPPGEISLIFRYHVVNFWDVYDKTVDSTQYNMWIEAVRNEKEGALDLKLTDYGIAVFQTKLHEDFYQACVMGRVSLKTVDVMHIVSPTQNTETRRLIELAKPYDFRVLEHTS